MSDMSQNRENDDTSKEHVASENTMTDDFKAKGYKSKSEMKRREIMEEKPRELAVSNPEAYDDRFKPREFWIEEYLDENNLVWLKATRCEPVDRGQVVCKVTEYSAYEALEKAYKHLERKWLSDDAHYEASFKNTALEAKVSELEKERDAAATTMAIIASKQLADLTLANDSLSQEVAELKTKSSWNRIKPLCETIESLRAELEQVKQFNAAPTSALVEQCKQIQAHADALAEAAQLFCDNPHVVSYEPLKTALAAYLEFRGEK